MKCGVPSVECEDFASSLVEKRSRLSREGHSGDRLASNYRSFILGKLPPPACPGLCYTNHLVTKSQKHFQKFSSQTGSRPNANNQLAGVTSLY